MVDFNKPFGDKAGGARVVESKPTSSKLEAFKKNDVSAAVASKFVESIMPTARLNKDRISPPTNLAQHVAQKTASNIVDNANMLQLLPDMELAMQVLISSILAPNNMMTCELNYVCDADDLGDLKAPLIDIVKNFFVDVYKINTVLPEMLEDVLFKKGSYPLAVLPESAIDEAINGSGNSNVAMEAVRSELKDGSIKTLGILGNSEAKNNRGTYGMGIESLFDEIPNYDPITNVGNETIMVTDNIDILKFPLVHSRLVDTRVRNAYGKKGIGVESRRGKPSDNLDLDTTFARHRQFAFNPVVMLRTLEDLDKKTVGHPLVLNLPSESIIPVHVPSEPRHHIGYFVALDKHGNPIRANMTSDYFADFAHNSEMLKDMSSQLLAQTRRSSEGRNDNQELMINESMMMYSEVIERDLRNRLKNGLYGDNVDVSRPTEVYRIMFARACARMQTQLLFIPIQLMTYIAFDYNNFGVGESLLEKTKILGSIRAMMLFSNTMAAIKNSTNHVELNIEFDPDDPDPTKTVEFLVHEFAKARQAAYPIGASNPLDMVNFIQNAGIHVNMSGHPSMPQTKMSVEDRQSSRAMIDSDLDESLRKRHLSSIGISPETVDLSMNVDFAQSIVNSNILLAKRSLVYQKIFTKHLSDFFQKFVENSEQLTTQLEATIEKNRQHLVAIKNKNVDTATVVKHFLRNLRATLPEPDMTRIENQKAAFELYSDTLDLVIPAFVSSDIFQSSIFGELNETVDTTIAIIKAHFQRRWLQNNDMLPELFELTEQDKNGKPVLDILKQHDVHMDGVGKSLIEFMKKVLPAIKKNDEELNKLKEDNAAGDNAADDAGGGEEDAGGGDEDAGGGDDIGADDGGGDDFDVGDDAPPEEEPAEDAPADDTEADDKAKEKEEADAAKEEEKAAKEKEKEDKAAEKDAEA